MLRFRTDPSFNVSRFAAILAAKSLIFGVLPLLVQSGIALAQDPAGGVLPFSTQVGGAYESIDLATSNIVVSIPVEKKKWQDPSFLQPCLRRPLWSKPFTIARRVRRATGM
jgi:hypothetical protein